MRAPCPRQLPRSDPHDPIGRAALRSAHRRLARGRPIHGAGPGARRRPRRLPIDQAAARLARAVEGSRNEYTASPRADGGGRWGRGHRVTVSPQPRDQRARRPGRTDAIGHARADRHPRAEPESVRRRRTCSMSRRGRPSSSPPLWLQRALPGNVRGPSRQRTFWRMPNAAGNMFDGFRGDGAAKWLDGVSTLLPVGATRDDWYDEYRRDLVEDDEPWEPEDLLHGPGGLDLDDRRRPRCGPPSRLRGRWRPSSSSETGSIFSVPTATTVSVPRPPSQASRMSSGACSSCGSRRSRSIRRRRRSPRSRRRQARADSEYPRSGHQSGNASGPRSASSEASFAWSADGSHEYG